MGRAPMTGHHYTLGAMKHPCRDRSWIGQIWKVLESNGKAVVIVAPFAGKHGFGREPMVVDVGEFDWTPADELAEVLAQRKAPA